MLLFSKIYEFYCLYGIEILLSGATGASRYCPALPGELHGFLARRSGATVEGSNNPTPLPRVKGKRVGCQLSQCHNSLLSFPTYSYVPGQIAFKIVERRMAPLSREICGLILPHDSFFCTSIGVVHILRNQQMGGGCFQMLTVDYGGGGGGGGGVWPLIT